MFLIPYEICYEFTFLCVQRKKLTKTKRSSHTDSTDKKEEPKEGEVDLCRVCKLRLEANRKYTHERFLVCANCNAKCESTFATSMSVNLDLNYFFKLFTNSNNYFILLTSK